MTHSPSYMKARLSRTQNRDCAQFWELYGFPNQLPAKPRIQTTIHVKGGRYSRSLMSGPATPEPVQIPYRKEWEWRARKKWRAEKNIEREGKQMEAVEKGIVASFTVSIP